MPLQLFDTNASPYNRLLLALAASKHLHKIAFIHPALSKSLFSSKTCGFLEQLEYMPKKMLSTKGPIRKPGVERHREIIEAAETLIRGGISPRDLTLQAVATRAGVPRVSLYYFFCSIEALLEVLYQRALNKMIGELGEIPEASEFLIGIAGGSVACIPIIIDDVTSL